jgi:hypothetical protein
MACAVLSLRHQAVHVFRIASDGSLEDVRTVGTHCDPGDAAVLRQAGVPAQPEHGAPGAPHGAGPRCAAGAANVPRSAASREPPHRLLTQRTPQPRAQRLPA